MIEKRDVIKVIDDVMNNREIDSIRNAVLAIRNKVIEMHDTECYARLALCSNNELCCTVPYFEGASYVVVDTLEKVDSGIRGTYWYE